jgi:peptidoglycan/LPS O-acetylase OafA/YrhL
MGTQNAMTAATRAPHRPQLQGFRGIVVLAVVAFHAVRLVLTRDGSSWADVQARWWVMGTARFGVDAFFVLAGFLVVSSWRSCRASATSRWRAARDFGARRAWRVLPPYLAMLAVLVPLTAPQLLTDAQHRGDLLRLLSVQQYLDPYLPAVVNVPIWSLTTEVHFYLVAPIVAALVVRWGGWRVALPTIALGIWWVQWPGRGELAASLLPGRLHQFVLGAAAGVLIARWDAGDRPPLVRALNRPRVLPALVGALLAIGTYHGATHLSGDESLLPDLVQPAAALLLAAILVRITCGPRVAILHNPLLSWFGGLSYSLYLWHYPILDGGISWATPHARSTAAILAVTVLLIAVGVAVAHASERWVEVPAAAWKKRRVEAQRRRTEVDAPAVPERVHSAA